MGQGAKLVVDFRVPSKRSAISLLSRDPSEGLETHVQDLSTGTQVAMESYEETLPKTETAVGCQAVKTSEAIIQLNLCQHTSDILVPGPPANLQNKRSQVSEKKRNAHGHNQTL